MDQRVPRAYIHDVAQVKGLVNLLPAKTHSCLSIVTFCSVLLHHDT